MIPSRLTRRDWLQVGGAVLGSGLSGWLGRLAAHAAGDPPPRRSCILLWMSGGPTQMDTFDLKPGHANGGPYKAIDTAVAGIRISEHLPRLARQMKDLAIVRSMTTREGDHARGVHLLQSGYLPQAPIDFPSLGALVAKELGRLEAALPNFVAVGGRRFVCGAQAPGSGYLGPENAPLEIGANQPRPTAAALTQSLKVADLDRPETISDHQAADRLALLRAMSDDFTRRRSDPALRSLRAAYARAQRLMRGPPAQAFDLEREPDRLREAYGYTLFGQGCLLARRLVERGVPFVQVVLGPMTDAPTGWDTHTNNFDYVRQLSGVLDAGWSTLLSDLRDRGLLDTTMIVWMGEFGRTPKINLQAGRDHFPSAWSVVLGGGGIRGGQVIGRTSKDGMTVTDRPTSAQNLLATICKGLRIDPHKTNRSNVGRPIRIVDLRANPILEVVR